jgi:hypothetical protein
MLSSIDFLEYMSHTLPLPEANPFWTIPMIEQWQK